MRGWRGCNPKSFALIGVVTDGALMRGWRGRVVPVVAGNALSSIRKGSA
jgi:expansin (peptidoglycan-binding protein)